ncbi:MAG TPA: MarR family transcriptional regulator [Candidatus Saccharimonadia bacterium]|nr:MarR family transcriptional regulator [Candidatus Saccharimonadia bacterium]
METDSKQVCDDLMALVGLFKGNLAKLAEAHDLTIMQLHALHTLQHGDLTMGQVAATLHCDASNVTGIVDRLVASQLITRQENAHDRRAKTLQLTAKGQRLIDNITGQLPAQIGCEKLTTAEQATLHQIVNELTAVRSTPHPATASAPVNAPE